MDIDDKARIYAITKHNYCNCEYDGNPYYIHLEMVHEYGLKFFYYIHPDDALPLVLAACWTHDLIEDARQTYNDVATATRKEVAEITYALTNEKGRTRSERANDKYYEGIRTCLYADYVKICDRLANVKYSVDNGSRMAAMYRKEHKDFKQKIDPNNKYPDMWDEMEKLLTHP